jgi:hypothetical protein
MPRYFPGDFKPQPFTVLGWHFEDTDATVRDLDAVRFNRYPGMNDGHPLGIWTAPGGTRVASFDDPFGSVLSLRQNAG